MDPNRTLESIRLLVSDMLNDRVGEGEWEVKGSDLAVFVDALDGWLCTGGFLPAPWVAAVQRFGGQ